MIPLYPRFKKRVYLPIMFEWLTRLFERRALKPENLALNDAARAWIQRLTSQEDTRRAEKLLEELYILAETPPPERIIWTGSPLSAIMLIELIKSLSIKRDQLAPEVLRQCPRQIRDATLDILLKEINHTAWQLMLKEESYSLTERGFSHGVGESYDNVYAQCFEPLKPASSISDDDLNRIRTTMQSRFRTKPLEHIGAAVTGGLARSSEKFARLASAPELGVVTMVVMWVTNSVSNVIDPAWRSRYLRDGTELLSTFCAHACYADYCKANEIDLGEEAGIFEGLLDDLHYVWTFPEVAIVCQKPELLAFDEEGRLHNDTGPSLVYPDGWQVFAWHGVLVPDFVVTSPQSITVDFIDTTDNAELRRVLIERYGQGRYIEDSGAEKIHQDDYGILYRKTMEDDEDLVMVKVINSTAEPDGTFKEYFLRVPPHVTTAREAVAWTFGESGFSYDPLQES